jgi:23S rRNA (pseudouridine1915-N3)-methyltransferase
MIFRKEQKLRIRKPVPIQDKNVLFAMKIKQISIGKTDSDYLKQGIKEYETRIKRLVPFESIQIPAARSSPRMNVKVTKGKEAEKVMQYIAPADFVVLLDEKGKELRSIEFADFLSAKFNSSIKTMVFITGGPFGFDDSLKARADFMLSLSKMTFSHQMVRLFFSEQLYRALSIINNAAYHHE